MVSEADGVRKPDPEIFLRAAAQLETGADEVVFLGDNPQADIAGAQRCGMKAIWSPGGRVPTVPSEDESFSLTQSVSSQMAPPYLLYLETNGM
jgi:FMN phosphatase YigB (HAD superfamily)